MAYIESRFSLVSKPSPSLLTTTIRQDMDHTNVETTHIAELAQNPNQAGSTSASISKDVGRNMSQDTNLSGGGLAESMDQVNASRPETFGKEKSGEFKGAMRIGIEEAKMRTRRRQGSSRNGAGGQPM